MKKILRLSIFSFLLAITGISSISCGQFDPDPNHYVSGYNVAGTKTGNISSGDHRLLDTVKNAINRVLGMLGLIALILVIRGGFQMLTAMGDDSKVKSGTKILKNAALGLVVIGLSWLFVTLIFYLINLVAEG